MGKLMELWDAVGRCECDKVAIRAPEAQMCKMNAGLAVDS